MVRPALRSCAVAGVLIVTLMFGGVPAATPVFADPGDLDSTSQDSPDPGGDTGDGSDEPGSGEAVPNEPEEPDAPEDVPDPDRVPAEDPPDEGVVRSSEPEPEPAGGGDTGGRDAQELAPAPPPAPAPVYSNSIKLPWLRLPAAGEIPAGSWPKVSSFYTTLVIPVPTLGEFIRALGVVPAPAPAPGPQFRTQEEVPVADAGTGTVTGGVPGAGGGGGGGSPIAEPVVFRAPLVTVPRSTTIAGRPTKIPTTPAGVAPAPGVTAPGAAGVRTPTIRGSVPPTPGATAPLPATAAAGQAPRAGAYSRGMTSPTVAEIAAVALPGVAGLLFLTFSGGMIGYRQANSARFVRTAGAERFLP